MTPPKPAPQADLFAADPVPSAPEPDLQLEPGAWLLRGFACDESPALLEAIERVAEASPFRHMVTPHVPPARPASPASRPMPASSTATSPARARRCIRTATKRASPPR